MRPESRQMAHLETFRTFRKQNNKLRESNPQKREPVITDHLCSWKPCFLVQEIVKLRVCIEYVCIQVKSFKLISLE